MNLVFAGINTFDDTPPEEWFQMNAVLRLSLGNFLFFAIFALTMIGVKDQNDRRDAWHHGGWIAKFAIWVVLVVLMFFVPNIVISVYGKLFFCCSYHMLLSLLHSNLDHIYAFAPFFC